MGQCGFDSVLLAESACKNDLITLEAHYSEGRNPEIDFCFEDFSVIDSNISYSTFVSQTNSPRSFTAVQDTAGQWYGFTKDINMTNLLRLKFGSSLTNEPVIDTVTLFASVSINVTSRGGMRFVYLNGNWYGMTTLLSSRLLVIPYQFPLR